MSTPKLQIVLKGDGTVTGGKIVHCTPYLTKPASLPSAIQHPSYGDCLEARREYYQNSSVLACMTQCLQSTAHLCEQFLQVKQIWFVTLGFGTLTLCVEAVA